MSHLKKEDSDVSVTLQECNDELLRAFREREWNQEWATRRLTTARDLYDDEHLDLVHDEYVKFVGMDYDFKRKPFDPTTNHDHLAFETNPWLNHKEYSQTRKVFDTFQEPIKTKTDLEVFFQDVHTRGNKKHRPRPKRRLKLYAQDFIKRAAVGDDGITHKDGSPLKPREINAHVSAMTNGSMGATGNAVRQWRSRIKADPSKLKDEYVEYTSSVSVAHEYVTSHFINHKGKAIKRESSMRMIPKK